jgi:hypothetical protein
MPPAVCNEQTSGYVHYNLLDKWVYLDDFSIVIEVAQEVANQDFASRHGTRATKNKGCTGPLCRKALRDDLYGGAKSVTLARLDELLALLQHHHDATWFGSLDEENRSKMAASIERNMETMQRRLDLVRAG